MFDYMHEEQSLFYQVRFYISNFSKVYKENTNTCAKHIKKSMKKQLMDEMSFKKIISNQSLIIQDLDKSYNSMCSFMELSNKYLPEAIQNFNIGQEHISKIRQNLDVIHKIMGKIKKKMYKEKQEEKIKRQQQQKEKQKEKDKEEEISTVTQAIQDLIDEEKKEGLEIGSPTLKQNYQKIQQNDQKLVQDELQTDQVQKLLAYYKLDDQQSNSLGQQQQEISPTTKHFEQAFTIIKSAQKLPAPQPLDEPLI